MAYSLAHLQDGVAAYPPCSLGSVFNSSWQAPPAPPPSRVSADALTPPLSQSAAFAAASPLSASLSAAASSSLAVPTAPVSRVHCLHRLRSSESNGDSDYDDDPDLFCQCYHDDDDGDIYSSGSDADDDAHDSRDGDDNAGAGPVQRQPKRRRTRTPASHAQRVYDNHYDHSLSATAVQHAITTHCCDEECIMRCFTVHELVSSLNEMAGRPRHDRKQFLLDEVRTTNSAELARDAPLLCKLSLRTGGGQLVRVCAVAYCIYRGIGHSLLSELHALARSGVSLVPPRLPVAPAASTRTESLPELRRRAHTIALGEVIPLCAEHMPTRTTDERGRAVQRLQPAATRRAIRTLVGSVLQRMSDETRQHVGLTEFVRRRLDHAYELYTETHFNHLLHELYSNLSFRRRIHDIATCNSCSLIASKWVQSCGDPRTREELEVVLAAHLLLVMRMRAEQDALRSFAFTHPSLVVYMVADQAFPGYFPDVAQPPKQWQRENRLTLELLAVAISVDARQTEFIDPNEQRGTTLYVYPPPRAVDWDANCKLDFQKVR